ncbi:MAG: T9SS type A sorting domain-containing protein [Flavobacteriales bacterium]
MRATTPLFLLLTGLFAWTANAVQAQTYFYLEQIAVVPTAPNVLDYVQLQLSGNLSSTGSSITSASADVNGYTINLALVTQNTTGLSVLVPHTEPVYLGQLAAGTYTVNITGFGVDDLAPSSQHVFTVSGSISACDSLILESLTWSPFNDTTLLVHILNPTATLFDYPSFTLLADNGDTLAKETINTFGIGTDNYNTMDIPAGTIMPASPFNATLQLRSGQQLACTWNLPVDLCPPGDCSPVVLDLRNFGPGTSTGIFTYSIRNAGNTVAEGSFELMNFQQYVQDTICLPPGNYLMEIIPQQGPNGGQPEFGVSLTPMIVGPHAPVIWTTLSAIAFPFYEHCVDIGQGIAETAPSVLKVTRSATGMEVFTTDSRALGSIHVFDAQGRVVGAVNEQGSRHLFNTAGWSSGLYVIRTRNTDGQVLTVRVTME